MPASSQERQISLLYVEDEPETRETLGDIIRHLYPELRLLISENGAAGLESFERHRPEIVITDINMPVINGIKMAAEIRSVCRSTEIIALTAHTNTPYLLQAIEVGISQYILKPIDIGQILKAIDKALASIRSERLIAAQFEALWDLNAELIHKAEELGLANEELETFNYSVAHDLRSPLAAIGVSQMLLDLRGSKLDDESKKYLQVVNREIGRMNSLIGAMLKFSVNSRKLLIKRWTNLSGIAHDIADDLLEQDPGRRATFRVLEEIGGFCDPDLMRVVLGNLLGNAWKYTAKKYDALIEFGTINREEDLVYFVRDNGAGFDQYDSAKLFVPFQRLPCDDGIEGYGIGLATASKIIERHGGRIWADGEKGKGATFYFTL